MKNKRDLIDLLIPRYHDMFAVFGDYQGNAPNTSDILWCTTKKEASAFAKKLHKIAHSEREQEKDENFDLCEIIPSCDGWQHSLRFDVRKVVISGSVLRKVLREGGWFNQNGCGQAYYAQSDEW